MPAIGISVKSNMRPLERLEHEIPKRTVALTVEAVEVVVEDIRAHWSGQYPPASQPGSPPATRTGQLDTSIEIIPVTDSDTRRVSVQLTVKAEYAGPIEFGTATMAARPFLRPALERNKETVGSHFSELVKEV